MTTARYSAYKPSGFEWLGDVPSHWRIDRLKASVTLCRNGVWGEEPQGDENDIPCVRVADFDRQRLRVELDEPTIRNVTDKERTGRLLSKGELLLEKSGGGENQPVGCVVLYDDARPAVCSNFVARVVPAPGQNSSYWRYVHAAAYAVRLTVGSINQTSGIQNLDQARYFNEFAAFPPPAEQRGIAAFLDRETAKIDALVEEQKRLIELLKEKRQAVISQAVTKGVDPNVPMKDSGVDWLGEVPEHWEVKRFGDACASISTGPFGTALGSADYVSGGIPVINPSHIVDNTVVPADEVSVANDTAERLSAWTLRVGDIVVARRGELGRAAVVSPESDGWICGTGSLRVTPNINRATADFLHAILQSRYAREWLNQASVGSTMANLNESILARLPVALPPTIGEQLELSRVLEGRLAEIAAVKMSADSCVALLLERRSALISAAVTGKIDVRGLAMAQPEVV